jgi:hypothetical protein
MTATRQQQVMQNALPVLIARLGGDVTITEAELDELLRALDGDSEKGLILPAN